MKKAAFLLIISAATGASAAPAADEVDYRLPHAVVPISQQIELRIDPAEPAYSGRTAVELTVASDVERIGVYQLGIDLTGIELHSEGTVRTLQAEIGDYDINWLSDGMPIQAGDYRLEITFSGEHSAEPLGTHRVEFEDNHYIFTQFEAMYGRRAIPLFDEPSFKIPFQLTIEAPVGNVVLSNTPVAETLVSDGWQRVEFLQTPPIPSYLVAYAIGPFDRAPIEGMSVPGYIYTPAGHADEVGFVQRETPGIVAALEDYFGSPYPFRKLDFLAVPDFAFGAMENPGLITYRIEWLLTGDQVQGNTAGTILNVVAHEVAHQWFGNLVTMRWWNDLWLNEAFTSWIADTTTERLYPEYRRDLRLSQSPAFVADQRLTARPVRKTVRTQADAFEDVGLNYTKGAAILRMLENYVGADVWQAGVRAYMRKYARSNASERDLWAAVAAIADVDVGAIARPYLNQPGYPLVEIDSAGKARQSRYVAEGVDAPTLEWQVPLSYKYKHRGAVRGATFLLDGTTGQLDVPDDAEWILPDAGGNGYYRWQVSPAQFAALLADLGALTDREKVALLDNTNALLEAGRLSLDDKLLVVNELLGDAQPLVVLPALETLMKIGDTFVDASNASLFARMIDARLGPRFAEIGAAAHDGDSEALLQLRPRLLRILGQYGSDPAVRQAAGDLAALYLESPADVDSGLALEALRVAALANSGPGFDAVIDAYQASASPTQRNIILSSVYFQDPETVGKFFDFLLTPAVPAGDVVRGVFYYPDILEDHSALYAWLDEHADAYLAKLPDNYEVSLPQFLVGTCSGHNLELMQRFFADRGDMYASSLEKAVETLQGCLARQQRQRDALMTYLARFAGPDRDVD